MNEGFKKANRMLDEAEFDLLNGIVAVSEEGKKLRQVALDELRKKYIHDPIAIYQLDVFDPASEVFRKKVEFNKALDRGDTLTAGRLREENEAYEKEIGLT